MYTTKENVACLRVGRVEFSECSLKVSNVICTQAHSRGRIREGLPRGEHPRRTAETAHTPLALGFFLSRNINWVGCDFTGKDHDEEIRRHGCCWLITTTWGTSPTVVM